MKNTFSNEQIQVVMEKSGITRKSALKKLGKMTPKELAALIPATPVTPRNAAIALNQENALKPEVAADYKARAANDDTDKQPEAPKAPATPKPVVPQTAAGAARGEGIRLYKLSNVATLAKDENTTTKALFQHVYGPKGHTMTWEQRAKVVGLATAEEAAKQFARMRGEKAGSCIVVKAEPKPEKK
jgi:hypothetical protein